MSAPSFAEAAQRFRAFLKDQGWPTEIVWVRAQDVRRGVPVLAYRGEDSEDSVARDYEAGRQQGVRLEALCTVAGATCATVTGGDDGSLTMTSADPRTEGEVRWPFC